MMLFREVTQENEVTQNYRRRGPVTVCGDVSIAA
jgi:hypothetical protein